MAAWFKLGSPKASWVQGVKPSAGVPEGTTLWELVQFSSRTNAEKQGSWMIHLSIDHYTFVLLCFTTDVSWFDYTKSEGIIWEVIPFWKHLVTLQWEHKNVRLKQKQ